MPPQDSQQPLVTPTQPTSETQPVPSVATPVPQQIASQPKSSVISRAVALAKSRFVLWPAVGLLVVAGGGYFGYNALNQDKKTNTEPLAKVSGLVVDAQRYSLTLPEGSQRGDTEIEQFLQANASHYDIKVYSDPASAIVVRIMERPLGRSDELMGEKYYANGEVTPIAIDDEEKGFKVITEGGYKVEGSPYSGYKARLENEENTTHIYMAAATKDKYIVRVEIFHPTIVSGQNLDDKVDAIMKSFALK